MDGAEWTLCPMENQNGWITFAGCGVPGIFMKHVVGLRVMGDRAVSSSLIPPVQSHLAAYSGHRRPTHW